MVFNLIHEAWIPVRRQSGVQAKIAPWQLTEEKDPPVSLDACRPDFNGALIQFMIGLVQTAFSPDNPMIWRQQFSRPPSPEVLKAAFDKVADAFDLDGNSFRFMQDLGLRQEEAKNSLASLLIDAPGDSTIKENKAFFNKENKDFQLCSACVATALFTLQTNAPSGGSGHRTSLRGGGPLTTIIVFEDSLWKTIYANVLDRIDFPSYPGSLPLFPWMMQARTSEPKTGTTIFPQDNPPHYVYWATPRRILLDFVSIKSGVCSLCGVASDTLLTKYVTKNYGENYEGAWQHPLSPYRQDKDGMRYPLHPQPGGIGYRHWLGLVQNRPNQKGAIDGFCARNVHVFRSKHQRRGMNVRLWAFGYDMDNMKARCWYDSTMPIIHVSDEAAVLGLYEESVEALVVNAQKAAQSLYKAVRAACAELPWVCHRLASMSTMCVASD